MNPRAWSREFATGLMVAGFFTVMLLAVAVRIVTLQTSPPQPLRPFLSERASNRNIQPLRGDLLDRRGRVLSTTCFSYRLIVDPVTFPDPADEAIVKLAEASGLDPGVVGQRVVLAQAENDVRQAVLDEWNGVGQESEKPRGLIATLSSRLRTRQAQASAQDIDITAWAEQAGKPPPLVRYLPIDPTLDRERADRVLAARIPGVTIETQPMRAYPGGTLASSVVGKVGFGHVGLLGAEQMLETRLSGEPGHMRYVRDAFGRPLWVGRGDWVSPTRGDDVRLAVDLEIQRIASEELIRGVHDADAAGGRIVVIDPRTGELLAMVDYVRDDVNAVPFPWVPRDSKETPAIHPDRSTWPRYRVIQPDPARAVDPSLGRNRCVEDVYEPGSTFKPFVWALARQSGKLPDGEVITFDPSNYRTPYGRALADVTKRAQLTWPEVLVYSSNIGMSKAAERVSHQQTASLIRRLGFGQRTELGFRGETGGLVTSPRDWTEYTQTSVAIGYEVGVTPVQMVRAFSAFARNGELAGTIPSLCLTAFDPEEPLAGLHERVFEPRTAMEVRRAILGVVERMDQMRLLRNREDVPVTYQMFGKSGTAKIAVTPPPGFRRPKYAKGYFERQYNSSFIAGAPFDDPRLVVLVIIDDPSPELVRIQRAYGSAVAGPVVRRVVERVLRYLGVPPDAPKGDGIAAARP